jgi:hypothetical protein
MMGERMVLVTMIVVIRMQHSSFPFPTSLPPLTITLLPYHPKATAVAVPEETTVDMTTIWSELTSQPQKQRELYW